MVANKTGEKFDFLHISTTTGFGINVLLASAEFAARVPGGAGVCVGYLHCGQRNPAAMIPAMRSERKQGAPGGAATENSFFAQLLEAGESHAMKTPVWLRSGRQQ
jgi:hypothetical protein